MKRKETKRKAKGKRTKPHHVGEGGKRKEEREANEGNLIKTWMFNEWFFWVKQQSNTLNQLIS